jgi:hypothetical protein
MQMQMKTRQRTAAGRAEEEGEGGITKQPGRLRKYRGPEERGEWKGEGGRDITRQTRAC